MLTATQWGRDQIRQFAVNAINKNIKGTVYLGRLSGSLFSDLTIDSIAIRETNDSLFVATGPVSLTFDPRDLFDRRIYAMRAHVTRPVVQLTQDMVGTWNFRKIFPPGPPGPPKPKTQGNFGDFIVVDNATLDNMTLRVTMPWIPSDSLRGVKRDSAVAFNLARQDKIIRRLGPGRGFGQTWEWTNGRLQIAHARVDDHSPPGRQFEITRLDVDEFYPPFKFRNARGTVRQLGDSAWLDLPHFDLPGSTGSGAGKVWWGSSLPTRYALDIVGDSVSLADVNWVYPTLPTSGGGKMKLRIENERDLHVMDYVLTDMDMRTMNSRMRGNVTFGSGAPVLIVKDVNARLDPLDFAFLHQINGKPLPYAWRGTITGRVRAAGGPVNRFRVDTADLVFQDANVPGAWAKARASGELDILFPAFTVFRGFDLQLEQFDLRTMQFLNPAFPHFDGIVAGTARLDSSWLDLRFRNADVTHRDGPGPASHFTGNGRVTYGERFLTYDLALDAKPISLGTIAHAYHDYPLPYRGEYDGPIRMQGTFEDLDVGAELRGLGGTMTYDGRVDADSIGGYAADGVFRFRELDLRVLYDTVAIPPTLLNGEALVKVRGDSLANYDGTLAIDLDRSFVDSVRVYGGTARLRFGGGRMSVDSLVAESVVASLTARGNLGVSPEVRDSMTFAVRADSLGGWRRYYLRSFAEDTGALRIAATDSMNGGWTLDGVVRGSVDSLGMQGTLVAVGVRVGETSARVARVTTEMSELTGAAHGQITISSDTLVAGGLSLRTLGATLDVRSFSDVRYRVGATEATGAAAEALGTVRVAGDTTDVGVDSLGIRTGDHSWSLARSTRLVATSLGTTIDPLTLEGGAQGRLTLAGKVPNDGVVHLVARADSVSMGDLGLLMQSSIPLGGRLDAQLDVRGARLQPTMTLQGEIRDGKVGGVALQRMSLTGSYKERRALGRVEVIRDGAAVLEVDASVPLDLRLASVARRLLDDTMRVAVRSRDVDLGMLEGFVPSLQNAVGKMNADFSVRGHPGRTTLGGFLRVDGAGASLESMGGERLRDVNIDLNADRDTVTIRRFVATSGPERGDSLWLRGSVALLGADSVPSYDVSLGARNFRIVVRPRVADLQLSANLQLAGDLSHSSLTGGVTIDRGIIYIPQFFEKNVVSLDDPDLLNIVDTTVLANRTLLPKAPPRLLQNLDIRNVSVAMGPDVRLRSDEANIKLGGAVNMTVARRGSAESRTGPAAALALDGRLQTEQGTYLLDLGVTTRLLIIEGGELRFFGGADLNPALDIRALHVIRQNSGTISTRNDIRIRVRLQGTFLQPRLTFESADSLVLSQSDLISYLVTGAPSLDIGGIRGSGPSVSSFATSLLSGMLQQALTGRFFDQVQIQAASNNATQQGTTVGQVGSTLINGLQFGLGKQINDRTWVSLQAGLCSTQQQSPLSLESIGLKVEHRLKKGYGISFGLEPPTRALFCGIERGFAPTPKQVGLDFYRAWRF
jgi:translocation and assembly module TamB